MKLFYDKLIYKSDLNHYEYIFYSYNYIITQFYKENDINIQNKINLKNCFTIDDKYNINYEYTCPNEIIEASKQYIEDNNDVLKFVKEYLEFTNNEKDFVLLKDIKILVLK